MVLLAEYNVGLFETGIPSRNKRALLLSAVGKKSLLLSQWAQTATEMPFDANI